MRRLWFRRHLEAFAGEGGVLLGKVGLHQVQGRVGIGFDDELGKLKDIVRQGDWRAAEGSVCRASGGHCYRQFDVGAGNDGPHFCVGELGVHAHEDFNSGGVEIGHDSGVGMEIELEVGAGASALTASTDGKLTAAGSDVDGEAVGADFICGRILNQVVVGCERGRAPIVATHWRVVPAGGCDVVSVGIQLVFVAVLLKGEAGAADGLIVHRDFEFGFFVSGEGGKRESERHENRDELYAHGGKYKTRKG